MSTEVWYPSNFAALRDANGLTPRIFAPGAVSAQSRVSARVVSVPNDMPSATGAVQLEHEFANDQVLIPASGGFTAVLPAGITSLVDLGMVIHGGGLSGGGYTIGNGHYWEEGMILVDAPLMTAVRLGNDPGNSHRGRLLIDFGPGNVPRFVWQQSTAAGGLISYVFTTIPVPLTFAGPGSARRPIYYRLVRNIPPGGSGKLQLRVWADGAGWVQEFTGVDVPLASSSQPPVLGGTPTAGGVYDSTTFLWWRAQGSDVYQGATDFGFSDYWTTPVVFQTTEYVSQGPLPAGFADSGIDDTYWHAWYTAAVLRQGGGKARLRWGATDTLPGGSAVGLLTEGPEELQSYNPAGLPLLDVQGRYLAIGLEFVPGIGELGLAEAALEGGYAGSQEIGFSEWGFFPNPSIDPDLVELGVGGEGAATAILPFPPHFPTEVAEEFRGVQAETEAGYVISRPLGTRARRAWRARWALGSTDGQTLLDFFSSQGASAFVFSPALPPSGGTIVTVAVRGPVAARRVPAAGYEIEAELVEVFP